MPLTAKGKKIKAAMVKKYGIKEGTRVFYASQNKGTIKGTHKKKGGSHATVNKAKSKTKAKD